MSWIRPEFEFLTGTTGAVYSIFREDGLIFDTTSGTFVADAAGSATTDIALVPSTLKPWIFRGSPAKFDTTSLLGQFTNGVYTYAASAGSLRSSSSEYVLNGQGNLAPSVASLSGGDVASIAAATAAAVGSALVTSIFADPVAGADFASPGSFGALVRELRSMIITGAFTAPALANAGVLGTVETSTTSEGRIVAAMAAAFGLVGGTLVAGSTAANIVLSGIPAGGSYVNQRLFRARNLEARTISASPASGGNIAFTFGSGAGEAGPFSTTPSLTAGEAFLILP